MIAKTKILHDMLNLGGEECFFHSCYSSNPIECEILILLKPVYFSISKESSLSEVNEFFLIAKL